ncbi:MAG: 8-oxo-dGTP diphosphatase [Clostridiales bacterium]|nr:8-oxo-dGTP diphosphatase [Clostridiales bacterium]
MKSPMTTLCYIEKGGAYLMMHRVKKKKDVNQGKWIGVGGHFEPGESPEECLLREVREETGLTLLSWRFRGIVTFSQEGYGTEYMCLYTADEFEGQETDCEEGILEWIPKKEIQGLSLWSGDRLFLDLLVRDAPFFSLKLSYREETLVEAVLDGHPIPLPLP